MLRNFIRNKRSYDTLEKKINNVNRVHERKKKIFQDYEIIFQISNSACMTRNIFGFAKKNENARKSRTIFVVKTKQQTLRNEDTKVNNEQPIFERNFPSRNDCTINRL